MLASVLQAASARDFLNAGALEAATRGRDLLKLAHCRTDSSPARPVRPPIWKADSRDTPPSFWALALHGSGRDAPWDYRGIPPPKDQSWGPDSIVLRLGPGVSLPMRTGRTDDMRSWSHRPRLCPPEATRGADGSRPPTSATIGGRDLRPRAATRGTTCNTLENKIPHSISPLHDEAASHQQCPGPPRYPLPFIPEG